MLDTGIDINPCLHCPKHGQLRDVYSIISQWRRVCTPWRAWIARACSLLLAALIKILYDFFFFFYTNWNVTITIDLWAIGYNWRGKQLNTESVTCQSHSIFFPWTWLSEKTHLIATPGNFSSSAPTDSLTNPLSFNSNYFLFLTEHRVLVPEVISHHHYYHQSIHWDH